MTRLTSAATLLVRLLNKKCSEGLAPTPRIGVRNDPTVGQSQAITLFLGLCAFAQPHLRWLGAGFIKAELWFDLRSDRQDAPPPQLIGFPRQALAEIYKRSDGLRDVMPSETVELALCSAADDFLSNGTFAKDLFAFLEQTAASTDLNYALAFAIITLLYRPTQRDDVTTLIIGDPDKVGLFPNPSDCVAPQAVSMPRGVENPQHQLQLVFEIVCKCVAAVFVVRTDNGGAEDNKDAGLVTHRHFDWARAALKAIAAEVKDTPQFYIVDYLIAGNPAFYSMLHALSDRTRLCVDEEERRKCVRTAIAVISPGVVDFHNAKKSDDGLADEARIALRRVLLRADKRYVRPPFSLALLAEVGGVEGVSKKEVLKYCEVLIHQASEIPWIGTTLDLVTIQGVVDFLAKHHLRFNQPSAFDNTLRVFSLLVHSHLPLPDSLVQGARDYFMRIIMAEGETPDDASTHRTGIIHEVALAIRQPSATEMTQGPSLFFEMVRSIAKAVSSNKLVIGSTDYALNLVENFCIALESMVTKAIFGSHKHRFDSIAAMLSLVCAIITQRTDATQAAVAEARLDGVAIDPIDRPLNLTLAHGDQPAVAIRLMEALFAARKEQAHGPTPAATTTAHANSHIAEFASVITSYITTIASHCEGARGAAFLLAISTNYACLPARVSQKDYDFALGLWSRLALKYATTSHAGETLNDFARSDAGGVPAAARWLDAGLQSMPADFASVSRAIDMLSIVTYKPHTILVDAKVMAAFAEGNTAAFRNLVVALDMSPHLTPLTRARCVDILINVAIYDASAAGRIFAALVARGLPATPEHGRLLGLLLLLESATAGKNRTVGTFDDLASFAQMWVVTSKALARLRKSNGREDPQSLPLALDALAKGLSIKIANPSFGKIFTLESLTASGIVEVAIDAHQGSALRLSCFRFLAQLYQHDAAHYRELLIVGSQQCEMRPLTFHYTAVAAGLLASSSNATKVLLKESNLWNRVVRELTRMTKDYAAAPAAPAPSIVAHMERLLEFVRCVAHNMILQGLAYEDLGAALITLATSPSLGRAITNAAKDVLSRIVNLNGYTSIQLAKDLEIRTGDYAVKEPTPAPTPTAPLAPPLAVLELIAHFVGSHERILLNLRPLSYLSEVRASGLERRLVTSRTGSVSASATGAAGDVRKSPSCVTVVGRMRDEPASIRSLGSVISIPCDAAFSNLFSVLHAHGANEANEHTDDGWYDLLYFSDAYFGSDQWWADLNSTATTTILECTKMVNAESIGSCRLLTHTRDFSNGLFEFSYRTIVYTSRSLPLQVDDKLDWSTWGGYDQTHTILSDIMKARGGAGFLNIMALIQSQLDSLGVASMVRGDITGRFSFVVDLSKEIPKWKRWVHLLKIVAKTNWDVDGFWPVEDLQTLLYGLLKFVIEPTQTRPLHPSSGGGIIHTASGSAISEERAEALWTDPFSPLIKMVTNRMGKEQEQIAALVAANTESPRLHDHLHRCSDLVAGNNFELLKFALCDLATLLATVAAPRNPGNTALALPADHRPISQAMETTATTEAATAAAPAVVNAPKAWEKGVGFGTGDVFNSIDLARLHEIETHKTFTEKRVIVILEYIHKLLALEINTIAASAASATSASGAVSPPLDPFAKELLADSCLFPALEACLRGVTMLEMGRSMDLYISIFRLVAELARYEPFVDLLCRTATPGLSLFGDLERLTTTTLRTVRPSHKPGPTDGGFEEPVTKQVAFAYEINQCAARARASVTQFRPTFYDSRPEVAATSNASTTAEELYATKLRPLAFDENDMCHGSMKAKVYNHHYHERIAADTTADKAKMLRLQQEVASFATDLPIHSGSAIFLRVDAGRLDVMKCLITGPEGTPYAHGCFLFDIYFPHTYPEVPPLVNLQTTGNGTVRFNPNLYNEGKVCLSLLGTWRGGPQERWDAKVSTLLQVLISIQALIFVDKPYFNEPGYETSMGTMRGENQSTLYNEQVRAACVQWAMVDVLKNPPVGFEEVVKAHFSLKAAQIKRDVQVWVNEAVAVTSKLLIHQSELLQELGKLD